MSPQKNLQFDALVLGGGIAGLEAALNLAEQDFSVAVVEKDASIGGKMIRLSKVFPTLDCSSCITTPKMAAAAHHPNITLLTYCELQSVARRGDELVASITQKPRYVDPEKCIGCRQCEYQCPVLVPDAEQGDFAGRKAIYIPFSNAIPPEGPDRSGELHSLRPLRQGLSHRRGQLFPGAGGLHPDRGHGGDRHRLRDDAPGR